MLQPPILTVVERRFLLRVAWESVATAVGAPRTGDTIVVPSDSHRLVQPSGAFVTLRVGSNLRGCIGQIKAETETTLTETVRRMAAVAATADPRFTALSCAELSSTSIEVSILGPLVEATDPERLEIGRHGVVVEAGTKRGLLLPQVAIERGWDSKTFLCETCRKAGLHAEAWRTKAHVWLFDAEVFTDSDDDLAPTSRRESA